MPRGNTAITWIAAEAKKIRKKHPNMKQSTAIKEAAAKYRAKYKKCEC